MKKTIPSKLAEILFAFIIGFMGINNFLHTEMMTGYVPDYMPGSGKIWIYISGACFILAAISILTGILRSVASYLLAVLMIIISLSVQLRGMMNATDEISKAFFLNGLLKDLAMAAAAIMIADHSSK